MKIRQCPYISIGRYPWAAVPLHNPIFTFSVLDEASDFPIIVEHNKLVDSLRITPAVNELELPDGIIGSLGNRWQNIFAKSTVIFIGIKFFEPDDFQKVHQVDVSLRSTAQLHNT